MKQDSKDSDQVMSSRYDEMQSEAVSNLLEDFREKRNGRYLLVIPTGGGKTYTAVKAINRLFVERVLDPQKDEVVWGAHRNELIKQAKDTFEKFGQSKPDEDYRGKVFIAMMHKVLKYVEDNPNVRIAVIDEAHHAVEKNITYGPLFKYSKLGILGLTATPSRHDGEQLDFEKESFSIGFPEMIERQLILSPVVEEVKGGHFEEVYAKGVAGFEGLEELDCDERDEKIIGRILERHEDYTKIIVYAASKSHVKNLHMRMVNSKLSDHYESIDYILGGNNYSGNDADRESFIERVKSYKRSIIINCDVLTEGYDDPSVNTVVMATPTRSKLVYMQAIGRCIRLNPDDPLKKAFVVEVVDELPNIRYRINNRWLFSEISDKLEPDVEDRFFGSDEEFKKAIVDALIKYSAMGEGVEIPMWEKSMRYSMLLFRSYIGKGEYRHIPIIIDGRNRAKVSNWFNYLSERMEKFHKDGTNYEEAMKMARFKGIDELEDPLQRELIFESMEEAYKETLQRPKEGYERQCWITFVSFRFKSLTLPEGLENFLTDVVNRQQIIEKVKIRSFLSGDRIIKLPLPLKSNVGIVISEFDYQRLESIMENLKAMKQTVGHEDHLTEVDTLLRGNILPIPPKLLSSLPQAVREDINYSFKLN